MDILQDLNIGETNWGASVGGTDGWIKTKGPELVSYSPIDGKPLAKVVQATAADYEKVSAAASAAFAKWKMTPAPVRGGIIREVTEALRENKEKLGRLVTLENGKIFQEGLGEVQEMIDIGDFALGLSRQLYGKTMQSERPAHRLYEQWHPLGAIGVITAFNFPVAPWSWNSLIGAVCGDTMIWKPSSKAFLTAIGVMNVLAPIMDRHGLQGLFNLVIGRGSDVGQTMLEDRRLPLISATGSCRLGRQVAETVGRRLGRSILELGGNNAIIITEDAKLDLAVPAALFGAVGTAGQRCTSTRRIIIHKSVKDEFVRQLVNAYRQVRIGNPLEEDVLMGPLIDQAAVDDMMAALDQAKNGGGEILYGGGELSLPGLEGGCYVQPTIVAAPKGLPIMSEETFAPILYIVEYDDLDEAMEIHNGVDQGLSSAIFTTSLSTSERFLSAAGSDCGLANVNIGTSGAEIGGAFGGEKDTGGGRESGSDAWKGYMRRQTNTINFGADLPLAQGITFGKKS